MKDFLKKIPKLSISALIFYLIILVLWKLDIILSPSEILSFLKNLFELYGLYGLFVASFLEGLVYIGMYFPGSFVVALAVISSDGSLLSLLYISLVVALALTTDSVINYRIGRNISKGISKSQKSRNISLGLIASAVHPNSLAYYFFNLGIKKGNFLKVLFVPVVIIPYGLLVGSVLFLLKEPLENNLDNPYIVISAILMWILVSFFITCRQKR